jgi:hypothetical protein
MAGRQPVLDILQRASKRLRAGLPARCHELAGGRGSARRSTEASLEPFGRHSAGASSEDTCA